MLWGSGGCCRPHCFWPSYLVSLGFLSSRFGHIWKRAIKKGCYGHESKASISLWLADFLTSTDDDKGTAQSSLPAIVSGGKLDQADATVSQNWQFHPEIVWDGKTTCFFHFLKSSWYTYITDHWIPKASVKRVNKKLTILMEIENILNMSWRYYVQVFDWSLLLMFWCSETVDFPNGNIE